jgi:cytochrome P450
MASPEAITDGRELLDPDFYAQHGPPHELWTELRARSPVHWCEGIARIEPFWAITRHADICWISSHPDLFSSEPGITPRPRNPAYSVGSAFDSMRVVITTDPPEHRKLRKVASPWFTPRALRRIDAAVEECARRLIDELGPEGETDLARGMATSHPLRILATALGVSREDEGRILELSNRLFAASDPELGAGNRPEDFQKLGQEFVRLFLPIIEDRRKNPTDDLASLLANGQIDGQPMGMMETLGYYLIVFNAGHDTTKNALAGGFRALIENPAELDKVRRDPSCAPGAVEEIVRWTSPVNYMKRTAVRDIELGGQKLRKGDALILFYGSANRDEAVFDDPSSFNIDRNPNRHLGFGYGEHFCLGAHMARRSQRALVEELAQRVEHWEITGEPEWIRSTFVIGLKHLPVRYRIKPR